MKPSSGLISDAVGLIIIVIYVL